AGTAGRGLFIISIFVFGAALAGMLAISVGSKKTTGEHGQGTHAYPPTHIGRSPSILFCWICLTRPTFLNPRTTETMETLRDGKNRRSQARTILYQGMSLGANPETISSSLIVLRWI